MSDKDMDIKEKVKDIGIKYGVGTSIEYDDYLLLWDFINQLEYDVSVLKKMTADAQRIAVDKGIVAKRLEYENARLHTIANDISTYSDLRKDEITRLKKQLEKCKQQRNAQMIRDDSGLVKSLDAEIEGIK